DNIVVADADGVLKTVAPATLVPTEPWRVATTTNEATANTENIYQDANVGIGDFSAAAPIAKLDVRGAVRGGTPHADEISGASAIGTNSIALGNQNKATGANAIAIGGIIGANSNIASG